MLQTDVNSMFLQNDIENKRIQIQFVSKMDKNLANFPAIVHKLSENI